LKCEAFGNPTKEALDNLVSRVCGSEETEHQFFLSVQFKLKEGFEDKHGFINKIDKAVFWKNAPKKKLTPPKIVCENGYVRVTF